MHPMRRHGGRGSRLAGALLLVMFLAWAPPPSWAARLTGRAPVPTGLLLVFDLAAGPPPAFERYFRVPEYTSRLSSDGTFAISLPAGRYAVGIYRSATGEPPPPRNGDILCRYTTPTGEPTAITLTSSEETLLSETPRCATFHLPDLDIILTAATDPARRPTDTSLSQTITGLSGMVEDAAGEPVRGILVFAKDVERGCRFVSRPTDGQGRFLVLTDRGGAYRIEAAGGAFRTPEVVQVDDLAIRTDIILQQRSSP